MKAESVWIWARHSVEAALQNSAELVQEVVIDRSAEKAASEAVAKLAESHGVPVKRVGELPRSLAERRHQGLAALLKSFPQNDFRDLQTDFSAELKAGRFLHLVYLDSVQDPRNYGAILRSAGAFGLAGVGVGLKNQCPLNGTVAQASAGNAFRLKNFVVKNFTEFTAWATEAGLVICALDGSGEDMESVAPALFARAPGVLWLVGAEGEGLHPKVLEKAHKVLRIPMHEGVESLNVSVAASLAFYRAPQLKAART